MKKKLKKPFFGFFESAAAILLLEAFNSYHCNAKEDVDYSKMNTYF